MVNINIKILLVLCKFISFCMSTDCNEIYYNIDEYKKYFLEKSLDLYNKETEQLPSMPISIDFANLMFYENRVQTVSGLISNYIESKSSKAYNVNIHTADFSTKYPYKQILFESFRLERVYDHTWSLFSIRYLPLSTAKKPLRHSHKLIGQKGFKCFIFLLFQMYKCLRKMYNNYCNDLCYISIEDISNGIPKNIPEKYQKLDSWLGRNIYVVFYVKIFTEIKIFDKNIDKSRMIELFNGAFGMKAYYLYGSYNLYIIDTIKSNLYDKNTSIQKTTKKTIMNQYILSFDLEYPPNLYFGLNFLYPERSFGFYSYSHSTEFYYFYLDKYREENEYKFKILFKHSYISFEFNFNWYNSEQEIKNTRTSSTFYLRVITEESNDMIVILRSMDQKYFIIENVSSSNYQLCRPYFFDKKRNIHHQDKTYNLKEFFDYLVFEKHIYIFMS
ncbi:hypothetical protein CWI38_0179p0020 [Hamiltosporidium tvaerminnensis]|uniref:Uncharacterized protein n=2 Tax=Hamiltosporidium tvaerminnensis TaxID=1176355 RepID=A0A4Q9M2W2_9MICR|nr:hypothetical protein CWI38_0306p0020 [Hamiltosporidium tvaerminnensis]TBU19891.1 hypothetical protein CWI38_0179p0020 [Hamiltosporidium tvaerminnensis]